MTAQKALTPTVLTMKKHHSKYKLSDTIFIDENVANRKKYECPVCEYLLKDAVQTSCGHWTCQDCAVQLFEENTKPKCPRVECGDLLEVEDGNEYFPDKFVRKDIGKYRVRCVFAANKCPWTGQLQNLNDHLNVCSYQQETCVHCLESFSLKEIEDHQLNCPNALMHCPFKDYGCEITIEMTRKDCDAHLVAYVASHSRLLVQMIKVFKEKFGNNWDQVLTGGGTQTTSLVRGNLPSDSHYSSRTVQSDGPTCTGATNDSGSRIESLQKQISAKDSQIRHLQDKLQQVEATILAKTTENEDRDFRLSLMENSNYDGTMLWKVPQFTQRMDDARTGKYTSIFSLPFYSGRYGYKMCLRLYILGDGIGKGSHMSLFFVLMKGEFDNILQWPFNHKVTFKLINQCGGRDVVDVFQPDPLSSSFQKPKTDMNIASGCPRFVSLNELMQNGFVMDDTIFIKVKVDTTTMKHP